MSANRALVPVWYWVSTDVNNREGVFRSPGAVQMLREVLRDTRKIYEFEIRGLRVEADRVSFYINAVDGVAVMLLNRGQLPQKNVPILKNLKKNIFFAVFLRWIKAYPLVIALVRWGKLFP
jgi:REP element-mobilizing transposase RayT